MSVGNVLASARRQSGRSIVDVEKATKIRARYLSALEQNDFAAVPGDVYAKGFIRTYAKYLGLDPEPLIHQYSMEYVHPIKFDSRAQTEPIDEKTDGWMRRFTKTLLAIALLVGLLYWGATASKRTAEEQMKSQSGVNTKTPTSQSTATTAPSTSTTAKPVGVNLTVKATSDEGCWVSVSADGQQVFEGIIQKGQEQQFKANKAMTLIVGNAGGVSVKRDGKDIGPLGEKGAVVQKTFTVEGN
ncbi:MAG: DUF4115 domain-containing protein [Actinobacteria bacterium]|nr:DUF4115 domain-containing protein [Actinomycetota bacterium]